MICGWRLLLVLASSINHIPGLASRKRRQGTWNLFAWWLAWQRRNGLTDESESNHLGCEDGVARTLQCAVGSCPVPGPLKLTKQRWQTTRPQREQTSPKTAGVVYHSCIVSAVPDRPWDAENGRNTTPGAFETFGNLVMKRKSWERLSELPEAGTLMLGLGFVFGTLSTL